MARNVPRQIPPRPARNCAVSKTHDLGARVLHDSFWGVFLHHALHNGSCRLLPSAQWFNRHRMLRSIGTDQPQSARGCDWLCVHGTLDGIHILPWVVESAFSAVWCYLLWPSNTCAQWQAVRCYPSLAGGFLADVPHAACYQFNCSAYHAFDPRERVKRSTTLHFESLLPTALLARATCDAFLAESVLT